MIASRYLRRLEAWLADGGARLERLRYPRPGGETAAYRWIPPGTPRGRVLLAHGAGNDALFPLVALCKPLVRAGWELFAFDLDGHGRESTSVYTPEGIRGALAAAREAAAVGRPPLPLHLLGQSLGGALALHALATPAFADAASAVVLSAPLDLRLGARVALGELRGFLRPATLTQREHYGTWGLVPAVGPLRRAAYPFRIPAALRGAGAFGYVDTLRALLAELELERACRAIQAPVLLVYGGGDRLAGPEHGRRLAGWIRRAKFVELPGETHWSVGWAPAAVARVMGWMEAHA